MWKRKKLWVGVQAVTLAGLTALSGCAIVTGGEGEGVAGVSQPRSVSGGVGDHGEGEGEGGEGEGGKGIESSLESDDISYLTHLALMRGHLYVGHRLYQDGYVDHAKTHMKHPKSELYVDLVPALEVRGADDIAGQLEDLALSVGQELDKERVAVAYDRAVSAIHKSEGYIGEAGRTTSATLKVVVELLRVAAAEYAIAVVDGKMANAHEYQDSLGFVYVAKALVSDIDEDDLGRAEAVSAAESVVASLSVMWPDIMPPEVLTTEAGQLYGAASQIELLALGLDE